MEPLDKWPSISPTQKARFAERLKNWVLIRVESVNGDNEITNLLIDLNTHWRDPVWREPLHVDERVIDAALSA